MASRSPRCGQHHRRPHIPIALVTDTSTGIGQATALYLARHGFHVFANIRNPAKGAVALTDVLMLSDSHLRSFQLDVDDPTSQTAWSATCSNSQYDERLYYALRKLKTVEVY